MRWRRRFTVWLCNARNVKKVPGRKTDLTDAEWLADVAAHGMVRPSFVPPLPIRELRELTRYRKTQIDARAAEIQRLEKVLQDAGIKLTSVASKVLTQSGRAMVEALIAGERDGVRLAELAKGKMRPKIPALTEALSGHFGSHHAVACRRILGHLDFLNESVAALSEQIDARTAAFAAVYTLLLPVPGFDRLTIDVIIAETGADMARFPSAGDLASWAGVCPGSHESAGKRRNVSTTRGNQWLRRALIESARAAARTKEATSAPSTARSPVAAGPTRQPSPSPTRSSSWYGICSAPASYSRTSATTTSPPAKTPSAEPAVSSPSSKTSATPSPSKQPQPSPHNRLHTRATPNSASPRAGSARHLSQPPP